MLHLQSSLSEVYLLYTASEVGYLHIQAAAITLVVSVADPMRNVT